MTRSDTINRTDGIWRRIYSQRLLEGQRINQASDAAEAFYWRLHAIADDLGRFPADSELLTAKTYPRRRSVTPSDVDARLGALVSIGLVETYEAGDGERYGRIIDFEELQATRNGRKVARYPGPRDPAGGRGIPGNPGETGGDRGRPGETADDETPISDAPDASGETGGIPGKPGETGGDRRPSDAKQEIDLDQTRSDPPERTDDDGPTTPPVVGRVGPEESSSGGIACVALPSEDVLERRATIEHAAQVAVARELLPMQRIAQNRRAQVVEALGRLPDPLGTTRAILKRAEDKGVLPLKIGAYVANAIVDEARDLGDLEQQREPAPKRGGAGA